MQLSEVLAACVEVVLEFRMSENIDLKQSTPILTHLKDVLLFRDVSFVHLHVNSNPFCDGVIFPTKLNHWKLFLFCLTLKAISGPNTWK